MPVPYARAGGPSAPARVPRAVRPPQPPPLELHGGGGGVAVFMEQAACAGCSLAQRLRLGKLEPDGLSYKGGFVVRCYEVGVNKTATVDTIANLLQEVWMQSCPEHRVLDGWLCYYTYRKETVPYMGDLRHAHRNIQIPSLGERC